MSTVFSSPLLYLIHLCSTIIFSQGKCCMKTTSYNPQYETMQKPCVVVLVPTHVITVEMSNWVFSQHISHRCMWLMSKTSTWTISQVNFPSFLVQVCCSHLQGWGQLVPLLTLSNINYCTFLLFFQLPPFHATILSHFISHFAPLLYGHVFTLDFPRPLSFLVLALPQLHHLIPDGELTSIKITRADPSEPLAISIVGGNETPLVRILIQDIYREGVIARDGRLLPGDMILKVLPEHSRHMSFL